MANQIDNPKVLILDINDCNHKEKGFDLHNVKCKDLKSEAFGLLNQSDIVIFSSPGVTPQLLKIKMVVSTTMSSIKIEEEIDRFVKCIGEELAKMQCSDVYVEDAHQIRGELLEMQVKLRKFRKKW